MPLGHQGEHASQLAVIALIAAKIGCTGETLQIWMRQVERDQGQRSRSMSQEQERLKVLEREVRKASGYFVQAELDAR